MPARTRRLLQSCLLAVALNATAASPYLPLLGPPALRFEPPRVEPPHAQPQLPPLPPLEPKAAVAHPAPPAAGETTPGTQPTPLVAEPGTAGATANPAPPAESSPEGTPKPPTSPGLPPAAADAAPAPIENLTPQMFMKFFSGRAGTNAPGSSTTIFAPLPFIPPVPPAPPSSSATFQTTPPAKP